MAGTPQIVGNERAKQKKRVLKFALCLPAMLRNVYESWVSELLYNLYVSFGYMWVQCGGVDLNTILYKPWYFVNGHNYMQ